MEQELQEIKINRAVLAGLNSPVLSREENADDDSLEELAALLEEEKADMRERSMSKDNL